MGRGVGCGRVPSAYFDLADLRFPY